jgi:hypothetical protein
MRFFTFKYAVSPTYRKVFLTVIRAKDAFQAKRLLKKRQQRGAKIQIISCEVSD